VCQRAQDCGSRATGLRSHGDQNFRRWSVEDRDYRGPIVYTGGFGCHRSIGTRSAGPEDGSRVADELPPPDDRIGELMQRLRDDESRGADHSDNREKAKRER
jgi:hypothetical protein